ncbi:putative nucleotidyltransferase [Clostridium algifaecis]|uniref:Nucleotidyltransferase n=1 Tax=Clostridium algifaecis TaxID=1472040 RepID=A0ABS4KUI0_9CLOT|nr:putative nucleotidyltransferase [Clostridium algifaecis]
MGSTILKYQRAFNSAVDRLKKDDSILAVMVFGSMITGDLWDESDIDLFVIYDDKNSEFKNIYTEEKDILVHIKLMSKNKFLQINEENIRGGFIHRIISSSRLVFSKDMEITSIYDGIRYYPDIDRERWGMVYLGNLLKNAAICKKYLQNDGIYTAYISAVKSVEEFSKLYVNYTGHMISKDATMVAISLNDEFKGYVDNLFFHGDTIEELKEAVNKIIDYFQKSVDDNIRNFVNVLINYMREKDTFLSSQQIENDELFKEYDICMEEILNKLWEKNIIKKETRDYKIKNEFMLFKENVYFI